MGPPVQQQGPVYSRYDQERFRGKEGNPHRSSRVFNYQSQFRS